ncbi:amino acid ABC transporter permease [Paenibacillus kribbensis]|uniref:ABC transporter permease n=1 Tax=Paenibacillus kribbensis TaxID=172713 RepID=A0A222WR54_9BACL|nr:MULTISPECIES: amino acid ABC transporter permease [Paenibacillus]ASR49077.1 ABC transporter permease [Paenibacillus kribbensis]EHS59280.1 putative ABC transporter permease [Paenibacillus sp. Aloe-11]MEC0234699.1 amino acid ABC transporter permease [Paenibacillus kribbensis]
MDFDFEYMLSVFPNIIKYLPLTIIMAVTAMIMASILGLIVALIRNSRIPVLTQLAAVYISFFRAIPMLVQLFLFYFGLPQLIPAFNNMTALTAALIGLSLKEAAFLAEIFRAGLNSVDKGQLEAGLSVGMTKFQTYRRMILPQAARNALPGTGNTFITLIKETALAFTLGVAEMFAQAKMMAAESFKFFETYLAVGLLYWFIVIGVSSLQRVAEQRINRPYQQ